MVQNVLLSDDLSCFQMNSCFFKILKYGQLNFDVSITSK